MKLIFYLVKSYQVNAIFIFQCFKFEKFSLESHPCSPLAIIHLMFVEIDNGILGHK